MFSAYEIWSVQSPLSHTLYYRGIYVGIPIIIQRRILCTYYTHNNTGYYVYALLLSGRGEKNHVPTYGRRGRSRSRSREENVCNVCVCVCFLAAAKTAVCAHHSVKKRWQPSRWIFKTIPRERHIHIATCSTVCLKLLMFAADLKTPAGRDFFSLLLGTDFFSNTHTPHLCRKTRADG